MELAWWRGEADVVEAAEPGAGWEEGEGGRGTGTRDKGGWRSQQRELADSLS